MLKRFLDAIAPPAPNDHAAPAPDRVPLATCVILLEAAHIDDDFTEDERQHIFTVLKTRYNLGDDEVRQLMQEAQRAREESSDLWKFTHQINSTYNNDEKFAILDEVWRIFYSDGQLDGHEDHLAHQLMNLLNLNHKQLIDAKMRILNEVRGK